MLIFQASWSDYEEHGSIAIYEQDGRYFAHEDGHCVMASPEANRPTQREVDEEEVYELMEYWLEHED